MTTEKQLQANRTNALVSTGPTTAAGKAIVATNAVKLGVYSTSPVVKGLETAPQWEEYRDGILAALAPVGALELALAERVAGCLWRLRRVTRAESAAVERARDEALAELATSNQIKLDHYANKGKKIVRAQRVLACIRDEHGPAPGKRGAAEIAAAEAKVTQLTAALHEAHRRLQDSCILPGDGMLTKVIRYEGHLQRQMASALHELQRLQAARVGQAVSPPAVLDVTVHAVDGVLQNKPNRGKAGR